jgi:hypothetical protein
MCLTNNRNIENKRFNIATDEQLNQVLSLFSKFFLALGNKFGFLLLQLRDVKCSEARTMAKIHIIVNFVWGKHA